MKNWLLAILSVALCIAVVVGFIALCGWIVKTAGITPNHMAVVVLIVGPLGLLFLLVQAVRDFKRSFDQSDREKRR